MKRAAFLKFLVIAVCLCVCNPAFAQKPDSAIESSESLLKILFLGDSLTEGYQLAKEKSYPSLIEASLQTKYPQVRVINGGVSGSTTASGLSRLKWHLRGKPKPRILVLALGANDGLRGQPIENIKKNLVSIITLAKKEHMKILLAGMRIPANYGQKYTDDFEALFKQIAKTHSVTLIPFLLENVAAVTNLNLADGIHPNEQGYQVVAKTVENYLEPLVKSILATN